MDIVWVLCGYCLDIVGVLFGYCLDIVWIFTSIKLSSFCCMADSLMGCIFSSVVLDYVFDYCSAFTALGTAKRVNDTDYYIICDFI